MASERDRAGNPVGNWSYGAPRDSSTGVFGGNGDAGSVPNLEDTMRLSTGRWASPLQVPHEERSFADSPGVSVNGQRAQDRSGQPLRAMAGSAGSVRGRSVHDNDDEFANFFGGDGPRQNGFVDEYEKEFDDYDDYDDYDDDHDAAAEARRNLIEWAIVLIAAVLLALLVRSFLIQAFWIPSASMESTLQESDRVLVNKLSYTLGGVDPESRGDVVVIHRTEAEIAASPNEPKDIIKRMIAFPGETIEVRDNVVLIDGQELLEPYLEEGTITKNFAPEVVPDAHVFIMGDNRDNSSDSRVIGPVEMERVVGRAFVLFWPLNRIGGL